MGKDSDKNEEVVGILTKIHQELVKGNEYASRTATNTKYIRQDVSGIRDGRTGADARVREDPLAPEERRQVNLVKARYMELSKKSPHVQLLPISRSVRREDMTAGRFGGYKSDLALNSRASTELKREASGKPPF